ncbi:MAG: MAPEG family protein [Rhodospirillales bacterium]
MALDDAQRRVMRNMLAALTLSIAALAWAAVAGPAFLLPPADAASPFVWALTWDAGILACLIVAIGNLARHRFFTPADIDGGGLTAGTERARVFQAVLQNTLEQAVIAVMAHLFWAAVMPFGAQAALPVAALLFVVGRICFAAGYAGGAGARAFGFALTFYPTVILTVSAFAWMIWCAT